MSDGDSGHFDFRGADTIVRLLGLDTPETGNHAKCDAERAKGEAAKAYAFTILPPGKMVDLQPSARREKWNRLLAAVTVDDQDYATLMIAKGFGVPYTGGTKPDWCSSRRDGAK